MPFIDTEYGPAYYRHWAATEAKAAVVFLHGFGEHTGLYHRYAFTLNSAGIDFWAIDQLGHGLSPGERGDFGSLEASSTLADLLTEQVKEARPGIPLVAQGHSFGAVATLCRLIDAPDAYQAGVISGAPLVPIPGMGDADTSIDFDLAWLSADPFYLDSVANDPLAFADGDGVPLARELDRAWDRFGADLPTLRTPTLAVHGENDPIADIGAVRAYADQIAALRLEAIAGGRHDILNDVAHDAVARTIIEFVLDTSSS